MWYNFGDWFFCSTEMDEYGENSEQNAVQLPAGRPFPEWVERLLLLHDHGNTKLLFVTLYILGCVCVREREEFKNKIFIWKIIHGDVEIMGE